MVLTSTSNPRVPSDLRELLWFPNLYGSLFLSFVAQKLFNQPSVVSQEDWS